MEDSELTIYQPPQKKIINFYRPYVKVVIQIHDVLILTLID